MSYFRKIEYEITLKESYQVIRNCPKCGRKTHYVNTKKFRVNANGSQLDIWLIYQCRECRHTLNLAIYERKRAASIPREEYQCFLDNDEQLAQQYGKDIRLFRRNKADIDPDRLQYDFVKLRETAEGGEAGGRILITVKNPHQLKIRAEKQIALVSGLSRNEVKSRLEKGEITLEIESGVDSGMELPQSVSFCINTSSAFCPRR